MRRRQFLTRSAALMATVSGVGGVLAAETHADSSIVWRNVEEWGIEGRGWPETAKYFDRLPARAEAVVRPIVWNLSRHSAGQMVWFETDATEIWVHHKVSSSRLAMPHMPATGVSGLDLYGTDEAGQLRWIAVTRPEQQEMQLRMVSGLKPGYRRYAIYLPLYNGTEFLQIGLSGEAKFEAVKPRTEKPLLFYGTSITHGACASRPGMAHPAIIGRRLNRPVINLGFSGNGRMEGDVGSFLCELDPAVYIIDCLPNMQGPEVAERTAPLVNQLKQARPQTPVLLVEDRSYASSSFIPSSEQRNRDSRIALQTAFRELLAAGVTGLYYLEGEKLLGADRDDTTDGSHPSDLGFYRHAEAFTPILKQILEPNS